EKWKRRLTSAFYWPAGHDTLFDMAMKFLTLCGVILLPCAAQQPRTPDLDAQRAAMKKLAFLVGRWTGAARILPVGREPAGLTQTEEAQFKLDGLILLIEGKGRAKSDGKPMLQALGLLSYDDQAGVYRMRAFNDGRFLETEVKLLENGK